MSESLEQSNRVPDQVDDIDDDGSPNMLLLFLINLGLAVIWASFINLFRPIDYPLGFLIGMGVLGIIYRDYLRRMARLLGFIPYVLWQIVKSNLSLAWTVIQPEKKLQHRLHPAIVAVPLAASTDLEITLLATIITLTPGTLSMDLGVNETGEQVLYVHSLLTENPDDFSHAIKSSFEEPILNITRANRL